MKIYTLPDSNPLTGKWSDRDVVAVDNSPNEQHASSMTLNSFVRIADDERSFLAQQSGLTAQCWRSLDVTDKVALEVLRQSSTDQQRTAAITEDRVNFHPLRLAGEISAGNEPTLQMVKVRPRPGATVEIMPAEEVTRLLRLPRGGQAFIIGYSNDLPIAMNMRVACHHALVAGATGSGKTTLNMQLLRGFAELGGAVVVFDHKPDYSNIGDMDDNVRLVLGHRDEAGPRERSLSVPASSLEPSLLAYTVFHRPSEHNQAECCLFALEQYAEDSRLRGRLVWSFNDFRDWFDDDKVRNQMTNVDGMHKATLAATARKLRATLRRPPFVDAERDRLTGEPSETFAFAEIMRPGRVTVIRLAEGMQETRGYALFLSYMMRLHAEYRQRENGTRLPLMCMIDEAQDIFSGTREFREAAEHTLQKAIRKARSLNTSMVIAPQSASAVPEQIMNNLNTRFVFRHNDAAEAKTALIQATEEQRKMTEELQPGECLASIFGTRMVFEFKVDDVPAGWRMTQ